jgi:hypothetical protein
MRIIFKFFLSLFLVHTSVSATTDGQGDLVFFLTISYQKPTVEQLSQKTPTTNPRLTDLNDVERFIFWNDIIVGRNIDKESDELKQRLSDATAKRTNDFFIVNSMEDISVRMSVLLEKKDDGNIVASFLNDWISEEDTRIKKSKQALLSAIQSEPTLLKILNKPLLVSFLVNNKTQFSSMGIFDFTGLCGSVYPASLRRKGKGFDINFDFSVAADGKAILLRKSIAEADEEVAKAFDKWIAGCTFNPKYFAGKQYLNKRLWVNFK